MLRTFSELRKKRSLYDLRDLRLQLLRAENIVLPSEAVILLRSSCLVSSNYSENCARVDLWFIHERSLKFTVARPAEFIVDSCTDPLNALFIAVIIQALGEVFSNRPCDLNVWRIDRPPETGSKTHCTEQYHICAPEATSYLLSLESWFLNSLNISSNFIQGLINYRKNRGNYV